MPESDVYAGFDVYDRMDQIAAPLLASVAAAEARLAEADDRLWLCVTADAWFCLGRMGDGPAGLIDLRGGLFGAEVWAKDGGASAATVARAAAKAWNDGGPRPAVEAVPVRVALERMVAAHRERLAALGCEAPA